MPEETVAIEMKDNADKPDFEAKSANILSIPDLIQDNCKSKSKSSLHI